MSAGGKILNDMSALLALLAPHCSDQETLQELQRMTTDHRSWKNGHALFQRIRAKTLQAERAGDTTLGSQYLFEEICAKTLYNLSRSEAPFDPDSPYWVIPNALNFARRVGVSDAQVIKVVAAGRLAGADV